MGLDLGNLRMSILVATDGVKKGLNETKSILQGFQRNNKDTEIQIKAKASGLESIQREITRLIAEKEKLEQEIEIKMRDSGISEAKKQLADLQATLDKLQKQLEIEVKAKGDTSQLEDDIKRTKEELEKLEEEISLKIDDTGISELQEKLKTVDSDIDKIDKELEIEVSSDGVDKLDESLKGVQSSMKDTGSASEYMAKSIDASTIMSAAAFATLTKAIKGGIDAFVDYTQTFGGLTAQMEHLGVNMDEVRTIMQEITADGMLTQQEAAKSIQALVRHGYELDETVNLMKAFKDIAVDNREQHLAFGEAVMTTSIGIQQGNAMLADSVGLTKRFGQIYQEYADSVGRSVDSLSDAEKRQIYYNYTLAESEAYTGRASEAASGLMGMQQQLGVATQETAKAFGEAMAPAVEQLLGILISLLDGLKSLIETFPMLTQVVAGMGIGLGAFTLAAKAAKVATVKLGISLTALSSIPVVAIIGGIAAAIALVVDVFRNAKEEAEEYQESIKELGETSERYNEILREGVDIHNQFEFEELQNDLEETSDSIRNVLELAEEEIDPFLIELADDAEKATQNSVALDTALKLTGDTAEGLQAKFDAIGADIDVQTASIEEMLSALSKQDQVLARNRKQIKDTGIVYTETSKAAKDYVQSISSLETAYQRLANKEDLSAQNIVELIKLYPNLAHHINNTSNWYETLGEAIANEANVAREAAISQLENDKEILESAKRRVAEEISLYARTTEESAEAGNEQLNVLDTVAKEAQRLIDEMSKGEYAGKPVEHVGNEGAKKIYESAKAVLAEIDDEIAKIDAQINVLKDSEVKFSSVKAKSAKSGAASAKSAKQETTELEKQLELLEERRKLEEMSSLSYLEELKRIKEKYAKTQEEIKEMDILIRPVYKDVQDEWLKAKKKEIEDILSSPEIDLETIENKYDEIISEIKVRYEDFAETQKDLIIEVEELRLEKMLDYYERIRAEESDIADERIKSIERQEEYLKRLSGYEDSSGFTFEYSIDDEIASIKERIAVHQDRINEIKSLEIELTDHHLQELASREEAIENYNHNIKLLQIDSLKETADIESKKAEELLKAIDEVYKEIIKREKELAKERTDAVKSEYDKKLDFEEQYANAEIRILEDKIAEIDRLLREQERAYEEEDYQDRIHRLEEQLKYEPDKENRYELQKEIDNLKKQKEREDSKLKLEEQKKGLQDELANVKDNLSIKKELLKEQMDEEIRLQDEALKAYEAKLKEEVNALKGQSKESLEELKTRYDKTITEYQTAMEEKEKKTKESNRIIRNLMDGNTTLIVRDLRSRLDEFSTLGSQAGNRWASSFTSIVREAISQAEVMRSSSSSGSGSSEIASASSASMPMAAPANISMNFNMPVDDPIKQRRNTEDAFKSAVRELNR